MSENEEIAKIVFFEMERVNYKMADIDTSMLMQMGKKNTNIVGGWLPQMHFRQERGIVSLYGKR